MPGLRQAILAALVAGGVSIGAPDSASGKRHTPEDVAQSEYEKYYEKLHEIHHRWRNGGSEQRREIERSNPEVPLTHQYMNEKFDAEEGVNKERARQLAAQYEESHKKVIEHLERIDRSFKEQKSIEKTLQRSDADSTDENTANYTIEEAQALRLWEEIARFSLMFTPDQMRAFKEYPNAQSLSGVQRAVERMDAFLELENSLRDRAMIKLRLKGYRSLQEPQSEADEPERG